MSSISIHTPAWGVTHRGRYRFLCDRISIHTPAWGVT